MVKLNSTTAILSDLDGVILDLNYDIKFWKSWLPEHVANQTNQSIEETQAEIQAEINKQRGTLNFYNLNYWDDLLNVDCMQIIKEKEEKCSYLEGSHEALRRLSTLKNPKHILPMEIQECKNTKPSRKTFVGSLIQFFIACMQATRKNKKNFGH